MNKGYKWIKEGCLLTICTLFLSSCTINRITEKERTITVGGEASIYLDAISYEMEFNVVTSGWRAVQLVADSDVISDRFIGKVKDLGVLQTDIKKSECTVTNPADNYECRRSIKVSVKNKALIPQIIDCKTTSIRLRKYNWIYPTDTESEIRQLRAAAIKNAKDIASLLTGASGTKIGYVADIKDSALKYEEAPDGRQKITYNVTITYDLQQ